MSTGPALDLELLRTLVSIADEGSFTRAASRIGRTQSAVSLQVRRLEATVGRDLLLRRKGGGIELTEAGRILLERSRELLALNDRILSDLRGREVVGEVRLGAWDDYSKLCLPETLKALAEVHPKLSVEVFSGLSCQLMPFLLDNKLDLIICEGGMEPPGWPSVEIWRTRLRWVTSAEHEPHRQETVPIAVGPKDCPWRPKWISECLWRGMAIHALEEAGRKYRVVTSYSTVGGQHLAVAAGDAVTVSTLPVLAPGLRVVRPDEGLPELPEMTVLALKAAQARQPVTDALADYLKRTFAAAMARW